jgi:hypothetical protein
VQRLQRTASRSIRRFEFCDLELAQAFGKRRDWQLMFAHGPNSSAGLRIRYRNEYHIPALELRRVCGNSARSLRPIPAFTALL